MSGTTPPSGENTIAIDFVLKARDYLAPLERLYRRSFWFPVALVAAMMLAIPLTAAIMLGDLSRIGEAARIYFTGRVGIGAYLVVGGVGLAMLFWSWVRAGMATFFIRISPLRGKPYRIVLAEKGVRAEAVDLATDLDWSAVRAAGFARNSVVLVVWTGAFLAFPRRAFASDEDYEAAADFVLGHLPPEARIAGRDLDQTRMSSTQ